MYPAPSFSRRGLFRLSLGTLLAPLVRLQARSDPACSHIGERLLQMEDWRTSALQSYDVTRHYSLLTDRADRCAEMEVHMAYEFPGKKYFQVLWEAGSSLVQTHVFQKLLAAEQDAATEEKREQSRICERNYSFRLFGNDTLDGRPCYVLGLAPRSSSRYLVEGRAWIDQHDFAVVRLEGRPAHNPSFWLRSVKIVQQYRKFGPFWLPSSNETETDVRLFGRARLNIEYRGYRIQRAGSHEPITSY